MSSPCTNFVPLTEISSEKYLKKLIGQVDLEDALRRLDRLTQEETQMGTLQNLEAVLAICDGVNRIEKMEVKLLTVDRIKRS